MISAYIHIPFCVRKCLYCDFASIPYEKETVSEYIKALCQEIRDRSKDLEEKTLRSVYFGGGTPSLLNMDQLSSILQALQTHFIINPETEITLEANPGTIDEKTLLSLRNLEPFSINRLSLGIQSFNEELLAGIGRIHTAEEARQTIYAARNAGFNNLSIDLIFALPRQTLKIWKETLGEALKFHPEHISLYGLTIEPGTPFGEMKKKGILPVMEEETEVAMYELAIRELAEAGYEHYEISNFAQPGFRSVHNQVYWRNEPCFGFGCAAASYLGGTRFSNKRNPKEYIEAIGKGLSPIEEKETLPESAAIGETLYVGLRMLEGVPYERIQSRFGKDLRKIYANEIQELVSLQLIELDSERIRLTQKGVLLANQVFEKFL